MSKKSKKAAPKAASPAPKNTPAAPAGLVNISDVKLRPNGRTGKFDAPAKQLIEAFEAGKEGVAFAVDIPRGLKPVKTYLYNALQKSLRKVRPDTIYRVSVRTNEKGDTAYLSISLRNED